MSFIILKSEYLKLIQSHSKLIAELPKAVQFCAAKLIRYFQRWSEWKLRYHRTMWIYMPFKKIHEDLMGEHSLHVIRAAITLLEKIGLIEKRHNPNGQDKTWQYKLNKDTLSSLLNIEARSAEPTTAIADYETLCDGVSDPELCFEHGTFKVEHGENNVEQHTQIQSIDIRSTNDVGAEEKTEVDEEPLSPRVNEPFPITQITEPSSTPRTTTTPQPTEDELHEVERQLRELRVNAAECKGVIRKYWANVQGAIALVKNFKGANKPIAVFIHACKNGIYAPTVEDTKRRSAIPDELRPPTHEESGRLDAAKERREIRDYYFSTVEGITKVVLTGGRQLPWWEFLQVSQC